MKKVKFIRVQQQNGLYSQNIPIGVDAENVQVNDEESENLQSKLAEMNIEIGNVNDRIDEIATLEQGSTTGDAELIDIRTSFDSSINPDSPYSSAGDAVRAQGGRITRAKVYINDEDILEIKNYRLIDDAQDNYDISGAVQEWLTANPEAIAQLGSPLVASTAAAMTDTSRIYVYTGSQSNYDYGYWYYYNNSTWNRGGVYQSEGIQTDTSLTLEDQAADAKAVGDAINDIIASEYTQKIYNIGDYCTKDNVLYKCSTAISTAEAWNSAHWTQVQLATDVADLKDEISEIEPGLSDEAKAALLDCFAHVKWSDGHGQDYYDALEEALYATSVNPFEDAEYELGGWALNINSGVDSVTFKNSLENRASSVVPIPCTKGKLVAKTGYNINAHLLTGLTYGTWTSSSYGTQQDGYLDGLFTDTTHYQWDTEKTILDGAKNVCVTVKKTDDTNFTASEIATLYGTAFEYEEVTE